MEIYALNALELGVYNHIAGDGREYVIADETAQKLRSEDGRFIKNVDIPCLSMIFQTAGIRRIFDC